MAAAPATVISCRGFDAFDLSVREPDEIAEKTMRGIRDNELYIFTHPELRGVLEDRFQRILAAYPKT
jgi:hypothetical protein